MESITTGAEEARQKRQLLFDEGCKQRMDSDMNEHYGHSIGIWSIYIRAGSVLRCIVRAEKHRFIEGG